MIPQFFHKYLLFSRWIQDFCFWYWPEEIAWNYEDLKHGVCIPKIMFFIHMMSPIALKSKVFFSYQGEKTWLSLNFVAILSIKKHLHWPPAAGSCRSLCGAGRCTGSGESRASPAAPRCSLHSSPPPNPVEPEGGSKSTTHVRNQLGFTYKNLLEDTSAGLVPENYSAVLNQWSSMLTANAGV